VPENGNVQVVVRRRRRTRRHRQNQLIRRWLAVGFVGVFIAGVSTLALQYLSPSLFHARQSEPPALRLSENRSRATLMDQALSHVQPPRPVYPYSVVPGGVEDVKELKWVAEHDPIVAAHYAGFDYNRARVVRLALAQTVYLSYRIGNHIYWTRRRVTLHKGETLITDGRMTARTRCANRVEQAPQEQAASPVEPPVQKFDEPIRAGEGTAMEVPPAAFESSLLNRPELGLDAAGPMGLYDPFVGGGWIAFSSPPLPLGVCSPVKKKGGGEIEIEAAGKGKTTTAGACGSGSAGVVPEPGTWLMFASGLIAIYWLARGKLSRA
jgi:PEP-CTERM motif